MSVTLTKAPEAGSGLANKHLISDQLWERLVSRIVKDEDTIERPVAERIMDQALAFLQLTGNNPDQGYSPSPMVDIGWHTFVLYTREYAAFCEKIAGRFIHHEPHDVPGVDYGTGQVARTVSALRDRGFVVDGMLWTSTACCGDSGGDCH